MAKLIRRKVTSDSDSISFISLASLPDIRQKNVNFQLICYTVAIIIVVISLVLSITLPFLFKYYNNANTLPRNQACVPCGKVEGTDRNGIIEFLGIPYAQPPIGQYKLLPPQEFIYPSFCQGTVMNDSKSIYQAKSYKPACLQYLPATNELNPQSREDCLYLNVYTPDTFPRKFRPVIVIINGLFHQYGSANMSFFTVTPNLVKSVDAVHVTFNYRMGPLSFTVAKDSNVTNFGLLDQIALLKWVKDNIKKFGGDPENIILYGIGSGATYSLAHLTSKYSHLFHKMWISGPGLILDRDIQNLHTNAYKDSNVDAKSLLKQCQWKGCTSQMIDLLDLTHEADTANLAKLSSLPVIDDDIIKRDYWNLLSLQKKIPIVIGMSSNAAGILPRPQTLRLWYPEEYELYAKYKVKRDNFTVLYSLDANNKTVEDQYTQAVTDLRMTCPIIQLGNQLIREVNNLVYIYQVSGKHDFVDLFGLRFATDLPVHGWDSALYFGSYKIDQLKSLKSLLKATEKMREYMREFVWKKTVSDFRHWSKQDQYINVIDEYGQSVENQFFKQSECKLWSGDLKLSAWRG